MILPTNKKFNNRESAGEFVDTLSLKELRELTIDLLIERENAPKFKPITISQEEFNLHFRISGVRDDGKLETRGRPRKM